MASVRPPFIAIEGIDGSGKSSVSRAILQAFEERGVPAIETREPGGTVEGELIRELLISDRDIDWNPKAELLLINAARAQHIDKVILPALAAGQAVVVDRFVGSTIAYQGGGRGMDEQLIRYLHREFAGDLFPDLTLVLDLDVKAGLQRSSHRLIAEASEEGKFERLDEDFHQRVRQSFLDQARQAPDRHVVIDASRPPEQVQAEALGAVLQRINQASTQSS